jgi:hypothetical protein
VRIGDVSIFATPRTQASIHGSIDCSLKQLNFDEKMIQFKVGFFNNHVIHFRVMPGGFEFHTTSMGFNKRFVTDSQMRGYTIVWRA